MELIYIDDLINILNTTGIGVTVYYSHYTDSFDIFADDEIIPNDYVKVPYAEEIEGSAMRSFWDDLGRSIWTIPRPKYRFLSYLKKHDLYYEYMKHEKEHCLAYMKAWAEENDIALDWDETIFVF